MILLIGPSASGKTETAKKLATKYHIQKVITYTTRSIRPNEIKDVDYHFISLEEFQEKIKEDFFLEYTIYNGNYYGTSKDALKENKVLIVEPKGLNNIRKKANNFIVIYFQADEEVLKARMLKRQDNLETINKRLANDKIDFDLKLIKPDYILDSNNLSVEELADEVYKIVQKS